jgi:hypothetical protein
MLSLLFLTGCFMPAKFMYDYELTVRSRAFAAAIARVCNACGFYRTAKI